MHVDFIRLEVHPVDHCNLSCGATCNHLSPFLRTRKNRADDYVPWIHKLADFATYATFCFSGGEPTLHPDLAGFITVIKAAHSRPVWWQMATNLRWLKTENDIGKMGPVLSQLNSLIVSIYQPMVNKVGGHGRMLELLEKCRIRYGLDLVNFGNFGVIDRFWRARFYDEPQPIVRLDCGTRNCTQLEPDGILYRCPFGHGFKSSVVPGGFRKATGMTFDLNRPFTIQELHTWRAAFPFDSCRHCGQAVGDDFQFVPWENRPGIREMAVKQFDDYLVSLPVLDEVPFDPGR